MDSHCPLTRVENPYQGNAALEPGRDLLSHLTRPIVRGDGLDSQVRRQRKVFLGKGDWQPARTHEGTVGSSDRVRVPANNESRFCSKNVTEFLFEHVMTQPDVEHPSSSTVLASGRWHFSQFPSYQLATHATAIHAEQVIGSQQAGDTLHDVT